MTRPRIKFTVNDYMTTPDDKRCQLLDGELIVAPSPTDRHQEISANIFWPCTDSLSRIIWEEFGMLH